MFRGVKQIREGEEPRLVEALPGVDFGPNCSFRRELGRPTARPDVRSPFQLCKCVTKGFRYLYIYKKCDKKQVVFSFFYNYYYHYVIVKDTHTHMSCVREYWAVALFTAPM